MQNLTFEGIQNIKDLAGIQTKDGKKIRAGKLYRSGMLCRATKGDLDRLVNEYGIRTVIDLRTKKERKAMPNPAMRGVSEIWNPLFTEDIQGLGVFKPDDSDVLANHLKSLFIVMHRADENTEEALRQVREMIRKADFNPDAYMARMYQKFVNNQIVQKQVKQFFSILRNNRGGGVLWHCAAGKDRTGMVTALLLYTLGVPKETIIEGYMSARESSEDAVNYILERLFPAGQEGSEMYREIAKSFFGAKACYIGAFFDAIEKDYVSIDNYIQKALEVHVDNVVRLKTLYLE